MCPGCRSRAWRVHRIATRREGVHEHSVRHRPRDLGHLWPDRREYHALHLHVFRETHGQIFVGNRQRSAGIAVDYGHRATPVALAGYTPVSQAVVDGLVSETPLLQPLGD